MHVLVTDTVGSNNCSIIMSSCYYDTDTVGSIVIVAKHIINAACFIHVCL